MSENRIKERMEVIGADGVHIGTVDRVENGKIKLTKADSGEGAHKGHHHLIDLSLVAEVEGQKVRCRRMPPSQSPWKKNSHESRYDNCRGARLWRSLITRQEPLESAPASEDRTR
jgi:hypothetical protein